MSKQECILCRHFVADVVINDNHEIFHGVCDFNKERKRFQDSCYRWEDVRDDQEKAIDLLDNLIGMITDNQDSDYDEALKMGIEALKEKPKKKWVINELGRKVCPNCGKEEWIFR